MTTIDRIKLRNMIKLELKAVIDEDALLTPPDVGEPHYKSYTSNNDYHDDCTDDTCDVCKSKEHTPGCMCVVCSDKKVGIFEGCGCGGSSSTYEKEHDLDYHDSAFGIDLQAGHSGEFDDHEHASYMARPQLRKISKYASKIFDMVEEGEQLEDWQESKIAQMSQMIGDVYHSIEYDEEGEDLEVNDIIGMMSGNI